MYVTNSSNDIYAFLNAAAKTPYNDRTGDTFELFKRNYENTTLAVGKNKYLVKAGNTLRLVLQNGDVIEKNYLPDGGIRTKYPRGWEITRYPNKGARFGQGNVINAYVSHPKVNNKCELASWVREVQKSIESYRAGGEKYQPPKKVISYLESVLRNLRNMKIK